MKRAAWLLSAVSGLLLIAAPLPAAANTMSVTQVITITARVADARSIIVNDKGQMVKIYSNTAHNVTPQVFLHDVTGVQKPLTPALLAQYKAIMSEQQNVVGVEIPVAPPVASARSVQRLLFGVMHFNEYLMK